MLRRVNFAIPPQKYSEFRPVNTRTRSTTGSGLAVPASQPLPLP